MSNSILKTTNRITLRAITSVGFAVGVVFLFGSATLSAQNIAYISSDAIFERLPQAIEARAALGASQAEWLQEIKRFETTIDKLRKDLEENRLLLSTQERATKEGKLRDAEAELSAYRSDKFGPNGEFERTYQQSMAPIIDLVMVAVNAEAEDQEYDFVFDKSSRGLPMLFANPEHDLTLSVLKRLGVEIDASELETKVDKPKSLLPESFPVQLGVDPNSTISLDPSVSLPTSTNNNGKVEIQENIELHPNELLEPEENKKSEESDPR